MNVVNEAAGSADCRSTRWTAAPSATRRPRCALRNAIDPDHDTLTYDFEVRDAGGAVVAATSRGAVRADRDRVDGLAGPRRGPAVHLGRRGRATGRSPAPGARRPGSGSTPSSSRRRRRPAAARGRRAGRGAASGARRRERDEPGRARAHLHVRARRLGRGRDVHAGRAGGGGRRDAGHDGVDAVGRPRGRPPTRGGSRASDRGQSGPWSATRRFDVLVDPAPAAPTGLRAVAGDARVHLDWNASPEPDVTGYRVYRALDAGRSLRRARGHDRTVLRRPRGDERRDLLLRRHGARRARGERALERGVGPARGAGRARGGGAPRSGDAQPPAVSGALSVPGA